MHTRKVKNFFVTFLAILTHFCYTVTKKINRKGDGNGMKRIVAVFLLCCLLCGCATEEKKTEKTVYAMDTVMQLQIWGSDSEKGIQTVEYLLKDIEEIWSVTRENSVLGQLNRGLRIGLSPQQQAVLERAEALCASTNGAFDPKLYSVLKAWGFYDKAYRVPTEEELAEALADPKWDLGGIIKGYAGREAAERLKNLNIDRAILNLGGNIQTYGQKPDGSPWQIGIQNPKGGDPVGVVSVTGTMVVVTSGDYQRYFEADGIRYHHIMDPKTGCPADSGLSSVTVICDDGMTADALSTALFVMGLEGAAEFWRQNGDFEAVFILSDGSVYATQGAALSGCEYEVIRHEK